MKPNTLTRHAVMLTATLLLALSWTSSATAQPNPFDAYEGKKQSSDPDGNSSSAAACDCDVVQPGEIKPGARNEDVTRKGDFVAGAAGSLSFTTSSNETSADTLKNTTLFIRLAPSLGYFVLDNLEVGASVGFLWRQIARSDDTASLGRDFMVQARGRYHLHVTDRFSLIPGLALGGYVGRNFRDIQALDDGELRPIKIETRTFGGLVEGGLDIGYLLTPQLQLQAGVNLIGLLGAERAELEDETYGVRTFNTSLNIGVARYF